MNLNDTATATSGCVFYFCLLCIDKHKGPQKDQLFYVWEEAILAMRIEKDIKRRFEREGFGVHVTIYRHFLKEQFCV